MTKVTIGADPELFVFDIEKKNYVSAHNLLPGSKWAPTKVPLGAVLPDGLAAEFNIEPAKNRKEFLKNLNHVRRIMSKMISKTNKNLVLLETPTAYFEKDYFNKLPEDVLNLGCDPDYNAYTLKANKKPETDKPMRTGSGHVHIGFMDTEIEDIYDDGYMSTCASLVKELDFVLLPASRTWDDDEERATLYGAPGAFRPKPYGVEYRSLSNKWLKEKWTQMYVHDATKAVTNLWLKGQKFVSTYTDFNKGYDHFCSYLESKGIPSTKGYDIKVSSIEG